MGHLISIVTINYNGLGNTCLLIDSIHRYLSRLKYEIVVVDNCSAEDELSVIQGRYTDVVCVQSNANVGFAAGNNLGLKYVKGDSVLFINNDVLFRDESLIYLLSRVLSSPKIAGVSPKIINA